MEHMTGGQYGLTFLVVLPIGAKQITIAADNLFGLWVPHNQLLVTVVTSRPISFITLGAL